MMFNMPTHAPITQSTRPRNEERRATPSMNLFTRYDSGVGKMYPTSDKSILTEGIRCAIARQDNERY